MEISFIRLIISLTFHLLSPTIKKIKLLELIIFLIIFITLMVTFHVNYFRIQAVLCL
jgi:hypothetical protein